MESLQISTEVNDQFTNGIYNIIDSVNSAYEVIQGFGPILDISDELTQAVARLGMMNDGLQSTQELTNMVYAAAQDSRGSFLGMADTVAQFGNNAKDAFGSSEEVVAFADLVQKQMTIAGASTEESSDAMLQLSQALGSGSLHADELNSIFGQAPNLIQNIADYLDLPIDQIYQMASEGGISADIVKAAVFAASDDINSKFEQMPMTWGQIWQSFQNDAMIAFQPVLERLNDLANSEDFQNFVNSAIEAMGTLSEIILDIVDIIGQIGSFAMDNWSSVAPVVYSAAGAMVFFSIATWIAKVAQEGLFATMLTNPIFWIALAVGVLVAAIYNWVQSVGGIRIAWLIVMNEIKTQWALVAIGIQAGVNHILNTLDVCLLGFQAISVGIQNYMGNMESNVLLGLQIMVNGAIDIINEFISLLNNIPGVSIDAIAHVTFGTDAALENQAEQEARNAGLAQNTTDTVSKINERKEELNQTMVDAVNAAAERQAEIDALRNQSSTKETEQQDLFYDYSGMGDNISDIAGNTESIADSMDITEEDLKYLRDLAEQEIVNRYTVAEINIDQSGMKNTIKNGSDIDGFMSGLTDATNEAVDKITEGVHK